MLSNCFQVVSGIGPATEEKLHQFGILNWDQLLSCPVNPGIRPHQWNTLKKKIEHLIEIRNSKHFSELASHIPSKARWLLYPYFMQNIAYLDIETTGLNWNRDHITTIAVFDGIQLHNFVYEQNLDEFPDFISRYDALGTFFGKGFDIPFLKQALNLEFPQIHFDACFLLRRIGLTGGLKKIEQKLGLSRGELANVDGLFAVYLWKEYRKTNDQRFLDTLLAYNDEDVVNLEYLLHIAYNELLKNKKFPSPPLKFTPRIIERPFTPYQEVLKIISQKYY